MLCLSDFNVYKHVTINHFKLEASCNIASSLRIMFILYGVGYSLIPYVHTSNAVHIRIPVYAYPQSHNRVKQNNKRVEHGIV